MEAELEGSTIQEKIDTLLDDPEDKRQLIKVLATLVEADDEEMPSAKTLEQIDKILKDTLKKDRIEYDQLSLVHFYLSRVGGS